MKFLPLFAVIVLMGCAVSTDELHANAMGCKGELIIESNGIVRDPTQQEKSKQCKPFWDVYNKRLIAIAKREREREIEQASACPRDTTKWCMGSATRIKNKNPRCSCVSNDETRMILKGRY